MALTIDNFGDGRFPSAPFVPAMYNAAPPSSWQAAGPCLSLWERWPSAARTERVNAHNTNERYHSKKRPKALSVSAAPSQLSHRESQGGGSVLSARVVFETWRAAGSCHAPSGPCLSLWERWPSAARTERVNAHDTNERYHSINAPRPSQSRLRRASSPRGRAKGLRAVLQ